MTTWAAPHRSTLTRGLLVGLCVCWPSYTSAEGTERDPSQDQRQTGDAVEMKGYRYRVQVVDADEINAFAVPTGSME